MRGLEFGTTVPRCYATGFAARMNLVILQQTDKRAAKPWPTAEGCCDAAAAVLPTHSGNPGHLQQLADDRDPI